MAKQSSKPQSNEPKPNLEQSPIEVLFEWQAPERIWSPKDRLWYLAYAALFTLLILASARLGYFIIILGLIALMFLIFVQASVAPFLINHRITTKGLLTGDTLLKWEQIERFWLASKKQQSILYLDFLPTEGFSRLALLIDKQDEQLIFNQLIDRLKYSTPEQAESNILSTLIYGEYKPISNYLTDLDQPTSAKQKKSARSNSTKAGN